MWQEQKKMAERLLANYQLGEARMREAKEDRSTHTNTANRRKDRGRREGISSDEEKERMSEEDREKKSRGKLSQGISEEQRKTVKDGEGIENRAETEQRSLCKVAAMRDEQAGRKTSRRAA